MGKEKSLRQDVFNYVAEKYGTNPEYLWASSPNCAVLRHRTNKKWYGIIMDVPKSKFGIDSDDVADILNVKIADILLIDILIHKDGFFPAYHMNKNHWISILLDGTVSSDDIFNLIDLSFTATAKKKNNAS